MLPCSSITPGAVELSSTFSLLQGWGQVPAPQLSQAHRFVLEKLGKLIPGLIAVGIALPVVRHVVDVCQDDSQQLLWAKDQVLVRDERPAGQGNITALHLSSWEMSAWEGRVTGPYHSSTCNLLTSPAPHTIQPLQPGSLLSPFSSLVLPLPCHAPHSCRFTSICKQRSCLHVYMYCCQPHCSLQHCQEHGGSTDPAHLHTVMPTPSRVTVVRTCSTASTSSS